VTNLRQIPVLTLLPLRPLIRPAAALGLAVLLSGCVSERQFAHDSWPFGNPNAPTNQSETAQRSLGGNPAVTAIAPQAGDVWPGPVKPIPTLSDINNMPAGPLGQAYTPSLPSPYPPGQEPPAVVLPPLPPLNPPPAMPDSGYVPPADDNSGIGDVPATPGDAR
jgi:hypothetical protein